MKPSRPSSRSFIVAGLVWFVIAVVLGATGHVQQLRPPQPQLILAALTVSLIALGVMLRPFRLWLFSLGYRQVIALHLTRFVGFYFLVLHARGELPYAFAVLGGWGDIAVAAWALVLVLLVPRLEARTAVVTVWNVVGMADLVFVVATASRLALADPSSMTALLRLPLSLLPTFVVPILLASHVILFWRLWVERPQPA